MGQFYGASDTGDRNLELHAWNGHGHVQFDEKFDWNHPTFKCFAPKLIRVWSYKRSKMWIWKCKVVDGLSTASVYSLLC